MGVSVRDVARRAGVSVGTVSNVLNGRGGVGEKTLHSVRAAIDELGYVRNDAARQLRAGRSAMVGLVVLDVRNPFFTELARGAEKEAEHHGLTVVLGNSDEDPDRESRYLDFFEQQRVRGILLSPLGAVAAHVEHRRARGVTTVLVDRSSDDSTLSSVAVDDVHGGHLAVRHLLERGRRRLAFVGGPTGLRQVDDRLQGARMAMAGSGARLEVVPTAGLTVGDGRSAGDAIARRPASDRPDAVFAANDLVGLGLLQSFVMSDLAVPADIALIGFDDIDFAATAAVPLSSIRQPAELMGRTALRVMLAEADGVDVEPQHVLFEPELVVRASTG